MVCARSDFYTPKASGAGQLVEAGHHLQRMLVDIPLTDDERAAVETARLPSTNSSAASATSPPSRTDPTANFALKLGKPLPLTVIPSPGK